ncbi:hypothetical protein Arcve_0591 [Archaeoglobus veneficus SNP6]|uniref:ArnR1-like winged helix-turn-helix domain-containing protein n=2 Tax=Archaeoglobus veneficus TaxID=58290 RepID=F2KQQ0_ARCVS|nr:hypothetical protein Arcve_0591 [Archaeoglobus veneficus SNP6]
MVMMSSVMSDVMKKFAEELGKIAEGKSNGKEPEEQLAELLEYMGILEKSEEGYRLTEVGVKFLKLTEA